MTQSIQERLDEIMVPPIYDAVDAALKTAGPQNQDIRARAIRFLAQGRGIPRSSQEGLEPVEPYIRFYRNEMAPAVLDGFSYTLKTGEPAYQKVFGEKPWERRNKNPELLHGFQEGMACLARLETSDILGKVDFSQYDEVIDFGGGTGTLLQTIMQKHPQIFGVLIDQPQVIAQAHPLFTQEKFASRSALLSGSLFAPPRLPVYSNKRRIVILKKVLLNWGDKAAKEVATNCLKLAGKKGIALFIEPLMPSAGHPRASILHPGALDIIMAVVLGGEVRTFKKTETLLATSKARIEFSLRTNYLTLMGAKQK